MTKREGLYEVANLAAMLAWDNRCLRHRCAEAAVSLCAIAKRLHRRAEADCNYGMPEGKRERLDARDVAKAREILEPFGLTCAQQGDPRGWPLLIYGQGVDAERAAYTGTPSELARVCPHV